MEQQTKEREALYAAVDPPGAPIPCNTEPIDVEDDAPSDTLLREVVGALKNDRAKGTAVPDIPEGVILVGLLLARFSAFIEVLAMTLGRV